MIIGSKVKILQQESQDSFRGKGARRPVQQNMEQWFTELYRLNAPKMVRYAYAQLRRMEVAEELVEDAFVLLLRKQEQVAEHPNPSGWLWKTLQHLILTEVRAARNRVEVPLEQDFDLAAPQQEEEALTEVLPPGLTPREREILLLYYEEELSHEEIARRLGISELNSRTRLFRARGRCRELMERERKILAPCNESRA